MKALTLWQPWASLVIVGAKPIEWRRWRAPDWATDQTIVIHAGSRRVVRDEVEDLIDSIEKDRHAQSFGAFGSTGLDADRALALLRPVLAGDVALPTAAGLGTAYLSPARLATEIVGGHSDSDRVDEAVWGWPLSQVDAWPAPFPMRGHQGLWTWPDAEAVAAGFVGEPA